MEIKDILKESGLSSTAHAVPNIIRAEQNCLKLFWTMLLIVSGTGCFILLTKDIYSFFEYEIVTKITVTNEISSEFPSIKICNKNNISFGIVNCSFGYIQCNYTNDFVSFDDFDFGLCWNFNSGKNQIGYLVDKKRIARVGKDSGLKLEVIIEKSDSNEKNRITPGLIVLIYNSSLNSAFNSDNEGIDVSTGLETNIIVNRLFINKKEKPFSKCISDIENYGSDIVKYIFDAGYFYRQKDCFDICKSVLALERIGCSFTIPLPMNLTSIFGNTSFETCLNEIYQKPAILDLFLSENTTSICETKCPLECSSIQYNSVFYHGIGDKIIKANSETRLLLNIYYDSLSYTTIDETPKTEWIDLISNTGGTLGLFLGISVLSLGEIFEIIFLVLVSVSRQNKVIQMTEVKRLEQGH